MERIEELKELIRYYEFQSGRPAYQNKEGQERYSRLIEKAEKEIREIKNNGK